jgi:Sulfotransferase family
MLERFGLFCGKRKDVNDEALFFVRFNDWLLRRSGASWDHPDPVRELFTSEHASGARALAQAFVQDLTRSPQTASFLGWRRYVRYRGLTDLDFPWGWKDPRTTFTLPLWQGCFPSTRIIHVMRHGVDVAHSLTSRHLAAVGAERRRARGLRLRYLLAPYRPRFFDTVVCGSLHGSFAVWERYAFEAQRQVHAAGERALQLRYEDLLADPLPSLMALADFCELTPSAAAIRSAAAQMRAERAYAHRRVPELRAFAEQVSARLAAHGYDLIEE